MVSSSSLVATFGSDARLPVLPLADAAAIPIATTLKTLKLSAGAKGAETPYDIMPLATLDPGTLVTALRPLAATAARLKSALASYERGTWYQQDLQDEVLSSHGVVRLEAFVNHVAEAYPSAFEPPSDKALSDTAVALFSASNVLLFSDFQKKTGAAQAEYTAMWDVYRKVRNTVTMTQRILEKLRPDDRGEWA